jgi:hypothetical protein
LSGTLPQTPFVRPSHEAKASFTRNVRRWSDGQMTMRWIACASSDAKERLRKLRGHRDRKTLVIALKTKSANDTIPTTRPRSIAKEESPSGRVQQASGHRPAVYPQNFANHCRRDRS